MCPQRFRRCLIACNKVSRKPRYAAWASMLSGCRILPGSQSFSTRSAPDQSVPTKHPPCSTSGRIQHDRRSTEKSTVRPDVGAGHDWPAGRDAELDGQLAQPRTGCSPPTTPRCHSSPEILVVQATTCSLHPAKLSTENTQLALHKRTSPA